ncbi:MAG: DeoR/GlpR transcriptional regulator [Desulfobacterales bacterium]|nr:MAG: DeoR/GlpR transcriptional regulator [Desulfobacterales bacterium]
MVSAANGTLFAQERKLKIMELLAQNKKVTVAELCKFFNVSSATIRNDLRELDNNGQLIRTHGGAIIETKTGFEPMTAQKKDFDLRGKQLIAKAAINLIEDGDNIILDAGTTTLELAKLLYQKKNLTVVTNDLEIVRTLENFDTLHIILMGGMVRKNYNCTIGVQGQKMLSGLTVDKAFMGTHSFSIDKGATTPDINQAETKKAMIESAVKIILLCSHHKLGKASFAQFASLDEIDTLVIDNIEENMKITLEEQGVAVVVGAS